jgi:hypothetical protein
MNPFVRALGVLAFALLAVMPVASRAAVTPTVSTFGTYFQSPSGQKMVTGYITLGAADTYLTGGFTLSPGLFSFNQAITSLSFGTTSQPYNAVATYALGLATVKLYAVGSTSGSITSTRPTATIVSGASQILATATTAVVSGLAGLTINTPIFCQLNDAATGGGGSGTWTVTYAVSTCVYTSASSFTITSTGAAPTGGGNFVYWIGVPPTISIPTISTPTLTVSAAELSNATSVANLVIPFVAIGF